MDMYICEPYLKLGTTNLAAEGIKVNLTESATNISAIVPDEVGS